jgi:uncharacterized protein (TIGR04255 family)
MKIPVKISPCPISEAIMEVRFKSSIFSSAVFGLVYNTLKDQFPIVTKLPILSLPDQIRETDPNLIYLPYYRLESNEDKNSIIQIGPRVFSIATVNNNYPGWNNFLAKINFGLKNLHESLVVDTVERFALRYINFFNFNIYDKSRLIVKLDDAEIHSNHMDFTTQIEDGDFLNIIKVANNAVQRKFNDPTQTVSGSIVDIDTIVNREIPDFFQIKDRLLEQTHDTEKKWFFKLITQSYLDSLDEVTY